MKYAILHDYGTEGHSFYGDEYKNGITNTKLFDTFGEAYIYATELSYTASWQIVGVFDKNDIKVDVKSPSRDKAYILKKDCPNIGKEIGDYYNGEYAESIEELLERGVIELEKHEE